MSFTHISDSSEQQEAEILILKELNSKLSLELSPKQLDFQPDIKFSIDGHDEKNKVICEIYSHQGKLKAAQKHKVTSDILKLLTLEKLLNSKFRKIICFSDESASKCLKGKSWLSSSIREFSIIVETVELPTEKKNKIIGAQKRQNFFRPIN